MSQRAFIQQEYRAMYSEELSKRLSSELSGNLKVSSVHTLKIVTKEKIALIYWGASHAVIAMV